MTVKIDFYVERNDDELELQITGNHTPGRPANLRGHPDNWSPPEGSETEIILVEVYRNKKFEKWEGELTSDEEKLALEKIAEQAEENPPEPDHDLDFDDNYDPYPDRDIYD